MRCAGTLALVEKENDIATLSSSMRMASEREQNKSGISAE